MSAIEDLAIIIRLACETTDRSDNEQHALLRAAVSVQRKANALTVTNRRRGPAFRLYDDVCMTRDPSSGPSKRNEGLAERLEADARRWDASQRTRAAIR